MSSFACTTLTAPTGAPMMSAGAIFFFDQLVKMHERRGRVADSKDEVKTERGSYGFYPTVLVGGLPVLQSHYPTENP